jgi:hypothetical protein
MITTSRFFKEKQYMWYKVVFLSGVNCSGDGYYSSDCHSRNCRTFFTKDNAALLEKCTGENVWQGGERYSAIYLKSIYV